METTNNMCCVAANIPTPCLLIDEDRLKKNIGRIHDYAARHGFRIRPHVKTHKSLYITRMQMAAGAKGIAVAKAGEALALLENPGTDILYAFHRFLHGFYRKMQIFEEFFKYLHLSRIFCINLRR